MKELSIWCSHGTPGDLGVFRSVAELRGFLGTLDGYTDHVIKVASGEELVLVVKAMADDGPFDHLVLAGHGGTTWWGSPRVGVTTGEAKHRGQITVGELADALHVALAPSPLISIAACMCSRSPSWFLRWRLGQDIGSDWGKRAYLPGGQASFSARLRDHLWWNGTSARIRGHRASGHASHLAILAEHMWPAAEPCRSLFNIALGDNEDPNRASRRRWVKLVTGDLAERWLMGDDSVIEVIRDRWPVLL